MAKPNRRWFLLSSAAGVTLPGMAQAQTRPTRALTVYKSPTCACCDGWVAHMREAGFAATVRVTADLRAVRLARGVPDSLASCHTGVVGGYAIEGHVPAADVVRLLAQRPSAVGITVPGMPLGSPGMESPGMTAHPYDVHSFDAQGKTKVFATIKT